MRTAIEVILGTAALGALLYLIAMILFVFGGN